MCKHGRLCVDAFTGATLWKNFKISFDRLTFWTRSSEREKKIQYVFILHHILLSEKIKGSLIPHDVTLLKFGKVS